jgi:hypothetical protein
MAFIEMSFIPTLKEIGLSVIRKQTEEVDSFRMEMYKVQE